MLPWHMHMSWKTLTTALANEADQSLFLQEEGKKSAGKQHWKERTKKASLIVLVVSTETFPVAQLSLGQQA